MKPDVRDGFVLAGISMTAVGAALWLDPWAAAVAVGGVLVYIGVAWRRQA